MKTTKPKPRYPARLATALLARKQSLRHPWNRGYPNNGKLRALKEAA